MERVGVYVPGGKAAYPSSVLMNILPAKVAKVGKIIMVTPPLADGKVNPKTLAAAKIAGVTEIYKVGGAQAIGDGMLISNGVSQLNELSEYVSSMGLTAEGEMDNAMDEFKEEQTKESEELAEKINEAVVEQNLEE